MILVKNFGKKLTVELISCMVCHHVIANLILTLEQNALTLSPLRPVYEYPFHKAAQAHLNLLLCLLSLIIFAFYYVLPF